MTIRVSREAEPQLELYGAHTAEVLGGAEGTISSLTFTPTSGTLILVHKNAVSEVQLEVGDTPTDYQIVGPNLFDVTETGIQDVPYAKFDLVDDKLDATITDGLTGQVFVAGDGGCYVSDVVIAAAGTFSIGGTTHNWTGAAPGILKAVTNNTGRVMDTMLREGDFTEAEIANLELFYRAQGGKGLLVPSGTELVTNGGFDTDLTGWADPGSGWSQIGGAAVMASTGDYKPLTQDLGLTAGQQYIITFDVTAISGIMKVALDSSSPGVSNTSINTFTSTGSYAFTVTPASGATYLIFSRNAPTFSSATIDNISVQRLIPREEL